MWAISEKPTTTPDTFVFSRTYCIDKATASEALICKDSLRVFDLNSSALDVEPGDNAAVVPPILFPVMAPAARDRIFSIHIPSA